MKLTKPLGFAVVAFIVATGITGPITTKGNTFMEQAKGQIPSTQNLPALPHTIPAPVEFNNPQVWNDYPSSVRLL